LYTETLRGIDTKAVAEAQRLAEELNARVQNLRGLVDVLDKNEGAQVQLTANKIVIASQTIRDVNAKNRKLIEGEMHYINGTLTLIAKAGAEKKDPYRTRKTSITSILVDAAA
jgi:flagellar biosynthesis/type III secretory pathway chaperone